MIILYNEKTDYWEVFCLERMEVIYKSKKKMHCEEVLANGGHI